LAFTETQECLSLSAAIFFLTAGPGETMLNLVVFVLCFFSTPEVNFFVLLLPSLA
jgi:hypothetical protein